MTMENSVVLHIAFFIATASATILHWAGNASAQKKLAASSNVAFSIKKYLSTEGISIFMDIICNILLQLAFGGIIDVVPHDYIKWYSLLSLFAFGVGAAYGGSAFIISIIGKTQKMLLNIIDKKTNISDAVEGKTELTSMGEGGAVTPPNPPPNQPPKP